MDPESLIPKLPRPRDLRPFPTAEALRYEGHTGKVRALSVDPTGQWLATGTWCMGCLASRVPWLTALGSVALAFRLGRRNAAALGGRDGAVRAHVDAAGRRGRRQVQPVAQRLAPRRCLVRRNAESEKHTDALADRFVECGDLGNGSQGVDGVRVSAAVCAAAGPGGDGPAAAGGELQGPRCKDGCPRCVVRAEGREGGPLPNTDEPLCGDCITRNGACDVGDRDGGRGRQRRARGPHPHPRTCTSERRPATRTRTLTATRCLAAPCAAAGHGPDVAPQGRLLCDRLPRRYTPRRTSLVAPNDADDAPLGVHVFAANSQAVVVHQLSKHQSQTPFRKLAGPVQRVQFLPSKPVFFVAVRFQAPLSRPRAA